VDLCKATLIGNVGRDPEQRFTQAGKAITSFSVACKRLGPPPQDGGERRDETQWFTVLCFGRLAEQALNLVTRGSRVYVDGRLQTRSYVANDGQTRFVVEIVANDLLMLGPRQRMGDMDVDERPVAAVPTGVHDTESLDDVPF
jgi:single-strand DNA-binding protein